MNILNMLYTLFFSLQNTVCFIILTYLVPVLFTFYIQDVLKLKKKFWRQNLKRPDLLWGPFSLLVNGYSGSLLELKLPGT